MNRIAASLVLAALALPACSQPAPPAQPEISLRNTASARPAATPTAVASASPAATALLAGSVVTGVVRAPKGISGVIPTGGGNVVGHNGGAVIPTGGGNVVGNNGGTVIPTGGGNLIAPGAPLLPDAGLRRLLAVAEAPLANTEVFVADAAGNAYPRIPSVVTDAEGRFTFTDVPPGFTVTVVARGRDEGRAKDVTLQTIVKTSELGATTSIDTATSLVTLAVLQDESEIGDINASSFRTATEATAKNLTDADVPDLSDRSAILAKVEALAASLAELKAALDEIRADIQDIKASIEDINQKLGAPQQTNAWQPPPPPPPGGQQPGGQQLPSCVKVPHELALKGTYAGYPLRLDVLGLNGQLVAQVTYNAPGEAPLAQVPDGCQHLLVLRDKAGREIAKHPPFAIPPGATRRVTLPL